MLKLWKCANIFSLLMLGFLSLLGCNRSDGTNSSVRSESSRLRLRNRGATYFEQSRKELPPDAKLACFPEEYKNDRDEDLPLDDEYLVFSWSQTPSDTVPVKTAMYQSRSGMAPGLAFGTMSLSLHGSEYEFTQPFNTLANGATTEQGTFSFNPATGRFVEHYRNAIAPQYPKIETKRGACKWIR